MLSARRRVNLFVALILCVAAAAACSKGHARTPAAVPADPPTLRTPEPPSRQPVPVSVEPPAASGTATEKPAPPASRGKPSATTTTTPPPVTPPDPVTSPVIQAGPKVEQQARARLKQALDDLKKVQRTSLPTDAREQYDSAERFARMAEAAILARNFVYASYCADKAATLAALLVKAGGSVPHV